MRLRVASSLSHSWAKEPIEAVDSGRRCRKTLREPVSVNSRTSLRSAEMEIGKWRAETGARNPPPKDENARNCRPETGACQPNPREDKRFSQTRKNRPGDRTAWLSKEDSNQSMHFICIAFSRRKTRAKVRRARSGEVAARNSISGGRRAGCYSHLKMAIVKSVRRKQAWGCRTSSHSSSHSLLCSWPWRTGPR